MTIRARRHPDVLSNPEIGARLFISPRTGHRDRAVPPANAEFLHQRLPRSRLDILDAGHFTWEDAASQYAALVTASWNGGYQTTDRSQGAQSGSGDAK